MIKKFKNICPEEEIIDGFSVLCFDSKKKLEKFSSSLNKNVQRLILNEINRPKTNPPNDSNISQSINISDFKHKVNLNPISPTRITTHRKSKPDMNALTLAICCNKRRTQTSPTKSVDRKIYCVEEYQKCADKENEDITINKVLEIVSPNCKENIQAIAKESELILTDYYATYNKDDSLFTENSLYATSTVSPISFQPTNGLHGDVESMDMDSPHKTDIETLDSPNKVDMEIRDSPNNVDIGTVDLPTKFNIPIMDCPNKVDIEITDSSDIIDIETVDSPIKFDIPTLDSPSKFDFRTVDFSSKVHIETMDFQNKIDTETIDFHNQVNIETMNFHNKVDIDNLNTPNVVNIETIDSSYKVDIDTLDSSNKVDVDTLDSSNKVDVDTLDSSNKVDVDTVVSPKEVDTKKMNSSHKVDIDISDPPCQVDIETLNSSIKVEIELFNFFNKGEPFFFQKKANKEPLNLPKKVDIDPLPSPDKNATESMDLPNNADVSHPQIKDQQITKEDANCEAAKSVGSTQEDPVDMSIVSDINNNEKYIAVADSSTENSKEVDDDCIITSIEFDPNPKLSCITLSSVKHLLSEIPQLKPAPQFISSPSIKTILLQNFQKSPPPPPLIPAPAYYFFSNISVCKSNPSHNNKSKYVSHKSVISPKLKSPKKCIMKSSIMKSSSNCVKMSSVKMNKNESNKPSIQSKNVQNPVVRSILQGTNNATTKLVSINAVRNQALTTVTPISHHRPILNKATAPNIAVANNKKVSKIVPNLQIHGTIDNNNKVPGPIIKRNYIKQAVIRKTQNQVDIAHWISQNLYGITNFERPVSINFLIPKPQVLKPLYGSFVPALHSNQSIIPSDSSHVSIFNLQSKSCGPERFPNRFLTINQIKQHQTDPQIFIRPLNSINSIFTAATHNTNSIFLNTTISNVSTSFCARPNLLPLP